ncbi:hypothetical protein K469DRAFT_597762, partial [Zopfia rhizophila CBS 207.26]
WIALGDSFSAGLGAGNDNRDSGHYMQRNKAYVPHIDADLHMPDHNNKAGRRNFDFYSCTGDTLSDMLEKRPNPINQIKEHDFATLSIGGNGVLFGPVVKSCIYGAESSYENRKKEGLEIMYSYDFWKRYTNVLKKMHKKLNNKFTLDDHTIIYQTSYIQFFDNWTN